VDLLCLFWHVYTGEYSVCGKLSPFSQRVL
jgi:hypothetical protein